LTSLIADSLTGKRHNPNRELVGQGIGNMVSGLFGGLPGSGSTTGTVTNIRAGGTTPVSGALYAVLILMVALGMGRYVEPIPVAVLAGILMKVGWDIIDWRVVARIHRIRKEDLCVLLITLGLTVFVDLITAVVIGLIVAGMLHAKQLENLELESVVSVPMLDRTFFAKQEGSTEVDPFSANVGLVALQGSFTVASASKLVEVIGADIKDHEVVIFDFSKTRYLDDSAAMVVENLMNTALTEHTDFIVMGLSGDVAHILHTLNILQHVPENCLVENMDEARDVAYTLLERRKSDIWER
ncbi:MAG: SulP family inorganic anion transporter, partial [Gammaproteobacteria bacterium]|nr:SulP family inorganic anion transporter [Gammaproteobacteria bacterium]